METIILKKSIGRLATCLALAGFQLAATAADTGTDLVIAHIYSRTGIMESYGKQTQDGLRLGFEYATGGTMKLGGRNIKILEKDDQGKPDVGKRLLEQAFADEQANIAVGASSSGVTLAMLPIAEEYKKVLIVEPAVADSITGEKWNKYVFRTGRNSTQDAVAAMVAIDQQGTHIATLAQDYAFGRDGIKAFKSALKKASLVHEEYLPATTSDFTAAGQRVIEKMKDLKGRKILFILWAGAGNPFRVADLGLERYGIEVSSTGNFLPAMAQYKRFPGMEGATYYFYDIPKNPANTWLVEKHLARFKSPPDFFTAGGFSAAMAVVTALKKTGGDTNTNKLIGAMEGMSFDTPKGKMTFRKEDHQAMQSMYHFKIKVDSEVAWGIPELVREIKPSEMDIPIQNKR
jgi:branched-chain amino acid transport system substrate-binding protein